MHNKKTVIKVGSNIVTNAFGFPDEEFLKGLVAQIAMLKQNGTSVILISSGAVASGRAQLSAPSKLDTVSQRQVFAALGQPILMKRYAELFENEQLRCAQVLVTKEDFRDRQHYLNMKNCLDSLLQEGIVPIVNENDVVSVTELMFTDNDELSGLVAAMLNVDALWVLTNVEGVFNGPPDRVGSTVIDQITQEMDFSSFITTSKSSYGRGGMVTKCRNALKVAGLGIGVRIANGKAPDVLLRLAGDHPPGTYFPPSQAPSSVKKWVANASGFTKGKVFINPGAENALQGPTATSLLLVGATKLEGEFEKGDIIAIINHAEEVLGYGVAGYAANEAILLIGHQNQKPLIHYDYLYLEPV